MDFTHACSRSTKEASNQSPSDLVSADDRDDAPSRSGYKCLARSKNRHATPKTVCFMGKTGQFRDDNVSLDAHARMKQQAARRGTAAGRDARPHHKLSLGSLGPRSSFTAGVMIPIRHHAAMIALVGFHRAIPLPFYMRRWFISYDRICARNSQYKADTRSPASRRVIWLVRRFQSAWNIRISKLVSRPLKTD